MTKAEMITKLRVLLSDAHEQDIFFKETEN